MNITVLAIVMLVVFMALLLSRKVNPLAALIIVPVLFSFIGGFGTDTFKFLYLGMVDVAPTFITLLFAILFFGMMGNAGVFDPVVKLAVKVSNGDPLRVIMASAILSAIVSLSGDGITSIFIVGSAFLPIYKKLDIKRVYLAIAILGPNGVINLVPWGGPTARIMSVTGVGASELTLPLIPIMIGGLIFNFAACWYFGYKERKRLSIVDAKFEGTDTITSETEQQLKRPKLFWVNVVLTVIALGLIVSGMIPSPIVFVIATALGFIINYRSVKDMRSVISKNADSIMSVVVMVLAAGVMVGIFSHSGMSDAIASLLTNSLPEHISRYFTLIIALISGPALVFLNNDGFYYGVLPALSVTAVKLGFTPLQASLASVIGQPLRGISPVVPELYFIAEYVGIDFGELQRTLLPFSVMQTIWYFALAFITGMLKPV